MTSRVYVVNMKAKGKVYLSVGVDKGRHRVRCGWYIIRSTSLVFNSHSLRYGELCKKCFKEGIDDYEKPQEDEEIEQFTGPT